MRKTAALAWSGGKDCTLALHTLREQGEYEVQSLLTTVTSDYDRISMHGVRTLLLEQQANSLGIRLQKVVIPKKCTNEEYEREMHDAMKDLLSVGVETVAFGDLFLEDVRRYREERLSSSGMHGLFPLWRQDTAKLARTFIDLEFKAVITCVDTTVLDKAFAGREFDLDLLSSLPSSVDPCGENGEFHTFVYDGPMFHRRIDFAVGESVLRENRFCFSDLIP